MGLSAQQAIREALKDAKRSGGFATGGSKDLLATLELLPDAILRGVVRSATAKAMTSVSKTAKSLVPRDSGLLRKSIGKKTKVYRRSNTVITLVGPRKGMKQTVTQTGLGGGKVERMANPSNYAHLVERGHRVVINRQGRKITLGNVAARPFLEPALRNNAGIVVSSYRSALVAGIKKKVEKGFNGANRAQMKAIIESLAAAESRIDQ